MKKQGMVVKSVVMLFVILVAVGCGGGGGGGSIPEQPELIPNAEPVEDSKPMSVINNAGNDLPADAIVKFKKTLNNGETCLVGEMRLLIDSMGAQSEVFAARYDPQGVRLWLQKFGNPKLAHAAQDMVCTEDVLYFLWGENDDETDKIAGDNYDAYVSSYSKEGTLLWTTQVGVSGGMSTNAMAGEGDYIFVVFQPSWSPPFVSKIGALEGETISTFFVEVGKDIAVYGGNIYICGSRWIDNVVEIDIVVYKYDFNGDLLWQRQWGSQNTLIDNANQIFVAADGVTVEGMSVDLITGGVEAEEVVLKYNFDGDLLFSSYSAAAEKEDT